MLVVGAGSQVGDFLLPKLEAAGSRPVLAPGASSADPTGSHAASSAVPAHAGDFDSAICLAPLHALPERLDALHRAGMRRLIAFSTTGLLYKSSSTDEVERRRIEQIAGAEEAVVRYCDANQVAWTIFRPTLIYGTGRDGNVGAIARFVRRFGFFPLASGGRGLRQPVHARDAAAACVLALREPRTYRNTYVLSGAEVVTYRQMVEAVFRQLGREPLMIPVPLPVLRAALALARRIPGSSALSPEMASRMAVDLCFDHGAAKRDFGFRPGRFRLDARAVGAG